jgi:EAL domain-containing protein (putative c-di-GMP-specific phosphodiesterase class I)
MNSLAGLRLLGLLSHPIQLRALNRVLHGFTFAPLPCHAPLPTSELPSEDDVRRGLALGEFRGWFQPQFDLRGGCVVAAETLARWEHPARGVLLPNDFLAAVLAYDLIDEMFLQLLEQGLSLLQILRRRGVNLTLAFNLHASQLAGDDLIENIKCALERHEFKGSTLVFELAENGLLDCSPKTHENLLRLKLLGCGLAIDDFGVGFSSLKWLCQLPFNQIKLDGRFVQRLDRPADRAIVASTKALVLALGMSLVIEGISNPFILKQLLELGCETGQGFYLERPMNGHALLQWLAKTADVR